MIPAFCVLHFSCRTARIPQAPVQPAPDTSIAPVVDTLAVPLSSPHADSMEFIRGVYTTVMNNRIGFTTFSGKIDLDYKEEGGRDFNVNAHLRMYKDSMIWISINAILGIEALRVRITQDSVKLLDKQNKIYTARPISYLQELTALPLDLAALQDLLLGNPVFFDSTIQSYSREGATISLNCLGPFFSNLFTVSETEKRVQQSSLSDTDPLRKRSCSLGYAEYENKKQVPFATKRDIRISDKKKLAIRLDFKQYDFNEKLSFPFNVPEKYLRN